MSIADRLGAYKPPDPSCYIPLQVTFHLASSVMLAYPWLHGDGLLARILIEDLLGDDYHNKLDGKKPLPVWKWLHLPLTFSHEVYHSSAAVFDTDVKKTLIIYKRFHESDRLKLKTKLRAGSGYFRAYRMQMPYTPASSVTFFMHGDLEEVRRLLSYVRFLGKKHAIGGGEVVRCEVVAIPEDCSLVCEGHIMRSIPAKQLKSFNMGAIFNAAYRFPYWDLVNVALCVVPGSQGSL
jgi:hypothetical protein